MCKRSILFAALFSAVTWTSASGQAQAPPPDAPEAAPAAVVPADTGFRFHGYLRSGFGVNGDGKGQEPFIAPLAPAKYRLGNEAETYLETTFAYGMAPEDDLHVRFDTQITLAYVTPTSQSNSFSTTFSLREAFARATGVWAAQPTASFWAGARYYDRHDVHINDFYYRDPSGFGGGLENVSLGQRAKFAFAWIGGSADELDPNGSVPPDELYRFNKNNFDFRLYELPAPGGTWSLLVDIAHFNGDTVQTASSPVTVKDDLGASGSLIYQHPFTGGRYKAAVQYGTGAASDFRSVLTTPVGRTYTPGEIVDLGQQWQFRIVNDVLVEQRGPWELQAVSVYQELDNGAPTDARIQWISFGARPIYRLGRYTSLAVEAGWDHTRQENHDGGSLVKLTVSPRITPTLKFLSRPSLRAFLTWARWSESFKGSVAPRTYWDQQGGFAAGVQLESWW